MGISNQMVLELYHARIVWIANNYLAESILHIHFGSKLNQSESKQYQPIMSIDDKKTFKAINKAGNTFLPYLPKIRTNEDQNKIYIERENTYCVDWENLTCTCEHFKFHGRRSICKHLVVVLVFLHGVKRAKEMDELEEIPF